MSSHQSSSIRSPFKVVFFVAKCEQTKQLCELFRQTFLDIKLISWIVLSNWTAISESQNAWNKRIISWKKWHLDSECSGTKLSEMGNGWLTANWSLKRENFSKKVQRWCSFVIVGWHSAQWHGPGIGLKSISCIEYITKFSLLLPSGIVKINQANWIDQLDLTCGTI